MNDRYLYATADTLRDLLIKLHDRGLHVFLMEETGEVGIKPSGSLTDSDRHTLRLYQPELAALIHGFIWKRRIARLVSYYGLTRGQSWLHVSTQATSALLARFEAKHGPLVIDLSADLYHALKDDDPEDFIKTGRDVAHELVKRLERERDNRDARVRSGMARLMDINHEHRFERYTTASLDTTDQALLAMLADLEPPASF